ncbi:hypothetical protein ACOMHN_025732 [Nucella lapillus]
MDLEQVAQAFTPLLDRGDEATVDSGQVTQAFTPLLDRGDEAPVDSEQVTQAFTPMLDRGDEATVDLGQVIQAFTPLLDRGDEAPVDSEQVTQAFTPMLDRGDEATVDSGQVTQAFTTLLDRGDGATVDSGQVGNAFTTLLDRGEGATVDSGQVAQTFTPLLDRGCLPLLPVIVVSAVDVELYRGGQTFCWMSLSAFYYAFLAPVAVIIGVNTIIYVLVIVSICRRPNMRQGGVSYTTISLRASLSCFVVLGLSWVFAFFALGEARVVFQYLFTCTTALQGFLIFALYTARDPAVRACLNAARERRKSRSGNQGDGASGSSSRRPLRTPSTRETGFNSPSK